MLKSNFDAAEKNAELENIQKLLSDPEDKKFLDVSLALSPNGKLRRQLDEVGVKIKKEEFTKQYAATYSLDEIKRECIKYNMAFVPTEQFKGEYSTEYIKVLGAFLKEKSMAASDHDIKTQLYILLPADNYSHYNDAISDNIKNPMIFYRVEEYFVRIIGDESYVNPWNYYMGIKHSTQNKYMLTNWLTFTAVTYTLFLAAHLLFDFLPQVTGWGFMLALLFFAIFGGGYMMIMMAIYKDKASNFDKVFNEEKMEKLKTGNGNRNRYDD